jgi:hypothetical protein
MTMEHIDRSFAVSLGIRHLSLDPGVVSDQLKLVPKTITRVGEQRRTPKGGVRPGTYPILILVS